MDPSDPRHGTANGYNNAKCRCEKCRQAWADYVSVQRQKREGRSKKDGSSPKHGSSATYTNWRCRCDDCTEAHRVSSARRTRRARARARLQDVI